MSVALRAGEFFGTTTARGEARGVVLSCLQHTAARKLPRHAHEAALFTMLLRGDYRERAGSRDLIYDPLTVVFHPPAHEHRDEIGAARSVIVGVEIARDLFAEYDLAIPQLARQSFAASRMLLALYTRARNGTLSPLDVESTVVELIGDAAKTPRIHEHAPPWLARVMEMLDALPSSVRVGDLAREANVHPVHFTRVFRRHAGVAPGEYLQQRRVRAALRILGAQPLSEVALASGFADQSHLCRALRSAFGETPRALARILDHSNG